MAGGKSVGKVLQQAQVEPALGPIGLELLGLPVKFDRQGKVPLLACGGGAGGQVFKLRRLFLGLGAARDRREQDKQKGESAGTFSREITTGPSIGKSASRSAFVTRAEKGAKNIAGWIPLEVHFRRVQEPHHGTHTSM
jgi:hypothetical protein